MRTEVSIEIFANIFVQCVTEQKMHYISGRIEAEKKFAQNDDVTLINLFAFCV